MVASTRAWNRGPGHQKEDEGIRNLGKEVNLGNKAKKRQQIRGRTEREKNESGEKSTIKKET